MGIYRIKKGTNSSLGAAAKISSKEYNMRKGVSAVHRDGSWETLVTSGILRTHHLSE